MLRTLKRFYFWTTGYSYTNLGRMFLRLFVGIMLLQFGVRQIAQFDVIEPTFPAMLGLSQGCCLVLMILTEVVCALFIMAGFMMRIMSVPPFISMGCAAYYLMHDFYKEATYLMSWQTPVYLPMMFMGVLFFLMLVGPGKISVDYFLSLHIIHTNNISERALEEV